MNIPQPNARAVRRAVKSAASGARLLAALCLAAVCAAPAHAVNLVSEVTASAILGNGASVELPFDPPFDASDPSQFYDIVSPRTALTVEVVMKKAFTSVKANKVFETNADGFTILKNDGSEMIFRVTPVLQNKRVSINVERFEEDDAGASYFMRFQRAAASGTNADLIALIASAGTLSPEFSPDVTDYSLFLPDENSVTLTPFISDGGASATLDGAAAAGGAAVTVQIPASGKKTVSIVVTASGGATKTYTVALIRGSAPTGLEASMSGGSVVFGWDAAADATGYKVRWQRFGHAWLNPNGADGEDESGTQRTIPALPAGQTLKMQVAAVAPGGILWSKGLLLPADASLHNLRVSKGSLTPKFDSATLTYRAAVDHETLNIQITPTLTSGDAAVQIGGVDVISGNPSRDHALEIGGNPIDVKVTAASGDVNTYRVIVTRAGSPDSSLRSLALAGGDIQPKFQAAVTEYSATVPHTVAAITITPQVNEPNASVRVNGAEAGSDGAFAPALTVGDNTIAIVVAAQDTTMTTTYTLTVTRLAETVGRFGKLTIEPRSQGFELKWDWIGSGPEKYQLQVKDKILSEHTIDVVLSATSIIPPVSANDVRNDRAFLPMYQDVTSPNRRTLPIPSLSPGSAYLVKFRACLTTGCLGAHDFTVTAGTPVAPANLTSSGKWGGFSMRWDAPADNGSPITNYEMRRVEHGSGGNINSAAATAVGTDTSVDVIIESGISDPGTFYDVQVRARNRHGNGLWSDVLRRVPAGRNPALPGIPTAPVVSATENKREIEISWSNEFTPPEGGGFSLVWWDPNDGSTLLNPGGFLGFRTNSRINSHTLRNMPVRDYRFDVQPYHRDYAPSQTSPPSETVRPLGGTNSNLSALEISTLAPLSPGFNANTLAYEVTVRSSVTSVTVRPTLSDSFANVTVNGAAVTSGRDSGGIMLGARATTTEISVVVTPEDDTAPSKTYAITVERTNASENADLFSLVPSVGTLVPAFDRTAAATTYALSVGADVTNIRLTPRVQKPRTTITVNGNPVADDTQSARLALVGGETEILIVTTAEDRISTRTYTLTVTRPGMPGLSADASILSAEFRGNGGAVLAFTPELSASTTEYAVEAPSTVSSYTVKASPTHPGAAMAFANLPPDHTTSGRDRGSLPEESETHAFPLKRFSSGSFVSDTTQFTISVTPQDGSASTDYVFSLKRGAGAPPAPSVSSVTERVNAVTLVWREPEQASGIGSDISGYRYRWSDDNDADWESADGADGVEIPGGAAVRSFTVRGLAANTAHTLQVAAVNDSGTGAWSASSREARPLALPSGAPSAVEVAGSHRKLQVKWREPASLPTEYKIRWALGAGSTDWINLGGAAGVSAGNSLRHTIRGLENDKVYEVQVGARLGNDVTWGDLVQGAVNPPSDITHLELCGAESSKEDLRGCTSPIEISPRFNLLQYGGYTAYVPFEVKQIRVLADTKNFVKFESASANPDFAATRSGRYSGAVPLSATGAEKVIAVKSVDAAQAYTFTITQGANTGLKELRLSVGELSPAFDPAVTHYTVELDNAVDRIALTPVAVDPANAVIRVDGQALDSGATSPDVALSAGVPRTIVVALTASEGGNESTQTYRITVTRQPVPPLLFVAEQGDLRFYSGGAIAPVTLPAVDPAEGTPAFSYSLLAQTAGGVASLPDGFSFNRQTRVLSGAPDEAAGTITHMLRYYVFDSSDPVRFGEQAFDIAFAPPLAFSSPPANLTFTYNTAVSATMPAAGGGFAPRIYSLSGLPSGLAFTPATRALSGTPDKAGSRAATYKVVDDGAGELHASFDLVVRAVAAGAPAGLTATPANQSLQLRWNAPSETGGETPSGWLVRWKSSGAWLNTNGAGGESTGSAGMFHTISGLTNETAYTLQVAAVNSAGDGAWSGEVAATPAVVLAFARQQRNVRIFAGVELLLTLPLAQNGETPYGYALTGLPAGLIHKVTSETVSIQGTLTSAGVHTITYTADDSADPPAGVSQMFTITILEPFHLDVNESGEVTAQDAIIIARYLLGVHGTGSLVAPQDAAVVDTVLPNIQTGMDTGALDVNGDGDMDGDDGILILRYVLGLRDDTLFDGMPLETGVTRDDVMKRLQRQLVR